ncbi:Hypothetical_protein [Hexamita inflata]|uniref:Hypothetical_protein n=1 Tax=Hexamita inflata TaxID=28002 RepID=A0AA86RMW0_9EUKA|nr:Hypothetical protein HINF_LOCUS65398 [Hexamita inflata]
MAIQEYFQNYRLLKQRKFINFATDVSVQYTNERIDAVVQNILNYPSQNIGRLQILNREAVGLLQLFSQHDYELATHRIQVIDQPQTFTHLIFYFTKQPTYKLQVTAGTKYIIQEVLAREYIIALMIFKSEHYLLAQYKFYKNGHFDYVIQEYPETQYFLAQSSCSQSTVASVPKSYKVEQALSCVNVNKYIPLFLNIVVYCLTRKCSH